ncbi:MAG TPA: ATP-binding protein [Candidatus Xenobia bacterium]|jgi:PAS domain S-box-containing protein
MRKPLRLLVIEDVEEDAELLLRDLYRGGYQPEFRRVEDADGLRDALAERTWDLIIADYSLPQFSALDALAILRESGVDLPFIIVSGTIGEETAVDAMRAGAHDFIVKGKTTRLIPALERELRLASERGARRQAEMALHESERRFRSLIENALDLITVIEPDGLIQFSSPSSERVLGYPARELTGRNFLSLIHPDDQPSVRQAFRHVFDTAGLAQSLEFRIQHQDGGWRALETIGKRMPGIDTVVVNARDVTERRRAAEALQEALAEVQSKSEEMKAMSQQLWHAAKLATMGELAASVAHELNNPLATVSLRVETLLMLLPDGDEKRRPLEIIEQEVERMSGLVKSLLESSRRSQRNIAPVDVREEIETSLELVHYHLRKRKVDLERQFSEVPTVGVDRQELRQVLLNLLTNASDAMPDGGRLSLRVFKKSDLVCIECADTGQGIEPENLSRVLEPFFTTKEPGKGTGLGLAICRRIVQEHYGTLEIESEPGQGTTVRVAFPTLVAAVNGL